MGKGERKYKWMRDENKLCAKAGRGQLGVAAQVDLKLVTEKCTSTEN